MAVRRIPRGTTVTSLWEFRPRGASTINDVDNFPPCMLSTQTSFGWHYHEGTPRSVTFRFSLIIRRLAINLDPNTPVTYYQRGVLIAKIGRAYEAFPDLERALQIAQAIGNVQYIANIQRAIRDLKKAVRQFHSSTGESSEGE